MKKFQFSLLIMVTLFIVFQSDALAVVKKNGSEFQVHGGDSDWPSIGMASDSSFVVAWRSGWNTLAQRYDVNGNPVGPELLIGTEGGVPKVAVAPDGSFVITWWGYDASGFGVFAQRYDPNNLPIGPAFQVNTFTAGDQYWPSVAVSQSGAFIVSWQSWAQDGSDWGVFAQRYDAYGNPVGNEFQVNTTTVGYQNWPSVAISQEGAFVITWQGNSDMYAQRYDNQGSPLGTEFRVNTCTADYQWQGRVSMASDGSFVVTWTSWGQDGSEEGIYAQRYDSSGNPVNGEFKVNVSTIGKQEMPSVAISQDGSFVITWGSSKSYLSGIYDYDIFARRYKASGIPDGSEFQVNTYTNENQTWPAVAAQNGSFVITWMSYWVNSGIFGQRFTYK